MFQAIARTIGLRSLAAMVLAVLLAPAAHALTDAGIDDVDVVQTLDTTQVWLDDRSGRVAEDVPADTVVAAVEETVASIATVADQLRRDADRQVNVGRSILATISLASDGEDEAPTAQSSAVEPDEATMSHAVVAASIAAAAAAGTAIAFFWTAGSTAGTAGGSAAAGKASAGLKRAAPILSPLFTRFEGKEVLKHPNRAQLYTLIAANPGVRLQDLCTETNLSRTAVTHHVRLLEQQHVIVSERVGRSRHYYENGGRYEREKKEAYAVLQNDRSRDIARFITRNPGTIQKSLCEELGMQPSIAHWHVKRLCEAALVDCVREGRTVSYFPASSLGQLRI